MRPPEMLLLLVLLMVAPLPNRARPPERLPQPACLVRWCRRRVRVLQTLLGLHPRRRLRYAGSQSPSPRVAPQVS
ncbi:hypothetical protein B0H13DRAFT_630625 [Mycena leptocephala]|nr:hypothetical protein B0H13DRAFT_630625 [Mycena leptocephala]